MHFGRKLGITIAHYVWPGLDPTNNKVVNEQYIRIAIGRDYDDVAPIRGTFYGGGKRRTMQVIVDVKRIAE